MDRQSSDEKPQRATTTYNKLCDRPYKGMVFFQNYSSDPPFVFFNSTWIVKWLKCVFVSFTASCAAL